MDFVKTAGQRLHPVIEPGVEGFAGSLFDATHNLDAVAAQKIECSSGVSGVGIQAPDDHATNATALDDPLAAGTGSASGGTGFQGHKHLRPVLRQTLQIFEGHPLSMRSTIVSMKTLRHNLARFDDHRANPGIGKDSVFRNRRREFNRPAHEAAIIFGYGFREHRTVAGRRDRIETVPSPRIAAHNAFD